MTNVTMLARNRLRLTRQALDSMWACTPFEGWNLTVLDDRSDEPTARLLSTYDAMRNDTPMGTGLLRNTVIAESERRHGRGDYLYISDNDVCFTPYWLQDLILMYDAVYPTVQALGAYNHPFNQPVSSVVYGNGRSIHEVYALASQSMLMRWSVWDTFGPFCETPVDKVCQSEDVAFSTKIREAGFKVGVVSPALVVNTGITNSFGEPIPGWEMVKAACPQGVICE